MISNDDLASAQDSYNELLESEVAQSAILQRPDRTKDSTGAANVSDWADQVTTPVIVEELGQQSLPFTLRNDNEVRETAYAILCKHDVDVRSGDRWVVAGVTLPYEVRSIPVGRTLMMLNESICVQAVRPSDHG